jgi:hypothetical protein
LWRVHSGFDVQRSVCQLAGEGHYNLASWLESWKVAQRLPGHGSQSRQG